MEKLRFEKRECFFLGVDEDLDPIDVSGFRVVMGVFPQADVLAEIMRLKNIRSEVDEISGFRPKVPVLGQKIHPDRKGRAKAQYPWPTRQRAIEMNEHGLVVQ